MTGVIVWLIKKLKKMINNACYITLLSHYLSPAAKSAIDLPPYILGVITGMLFRAPGPGDGSL